MTTTDSAKKIIKEVLEKEGLTYTRLTARTVSFSDLGRGDIVFVTIHGWQPNPKWNIIKKIAFDNKFCVEV
jgi:hypothetical protein